MLGSIFEMILERRPQAVDKQVKHVSFVTRLSALGSSRLLDPQWVQPRSPGGAPYLGYSRLLNPQSVQPRSPGGAPPSAQIHHSNTLWELPPKMPGEGGSHFPNQRHWKPNGFWHLGEKKSAASRPYQPGRGGGRPLYKTQFKRKPKKKTHSKLVHDHIDLQAKLAIRKRIFCTPINRNTTILYRLWTGLV